MITSQLRAAVSVLAVATLLLASTVSPAGAGGTSYGPIYRITTGYNDYFHNYDFESERVATTNVDWAISLYIYNGASVDRFKSMLENRGFGANSNDGKHVLAKDDSAYLWDRDGGKKGVTCPTAGRTTRHYRVYADGDQYMYHPGSGTYVVASTHRDRAECATSGKLFYDSERVEGEIVDILRGAGCPGYHDYSNFYNREPYRSQGTHVWDNNGLASYINTGYNFCR